MAIVTTKLIEKMIYIVRGQKVMLDSNLATLYEVETRILNRNVKRNIARFPKEFMFQLTQNEYDALKSQIGISKHGRGGRRKLPFVFTEQGVAMLSAVLNSDKAIKVSISIMKTFVKLRQLLATEEMLTDKITNIQKGTDKLFRIVFERLDQLEASTPILPAKRKKIGVKQK